MDLSNNPCRPRYAGWGSTTPIGAGSTAKVALLYAAHQVIADLDVLARRHGITDITALRSRAATHWSALVTKPKIATIARFDGTRVRPSQHLRDTVEKMIFRRHSSVSTSMANTVIKDIGFDFIGSLLWQSGLRHPTAKGLWFPNSFNRARSWPRDPFREGRMGMTARSVATLYTLLDQGRLIGPSNSRKMKAILRQGCRFSPPPGATVLAAKCGLTSTLKHNSMLLTDGDGRRYVAVVLTKGAARRDTAEMRKLMRGVHDLVKARNP